MECPIAKQRQPEKRVGAVLYFCYTQSEIKLRRYLVRFWYFTTTEITFSNQMERRHRQLVYSSSSSNSSLDIWRMAPSLPSPMVSIRAAFFDCSSRMRSSMVSLAII